MATPGAGGRGGEGGGGMNGVNLLPQSRLRAAALRLRVRRWIVGVAIYAAAMGAVCIAGLTHTGAAEEDTRLQLARAQQRLIDAELRTQENTAAATQLERSLAAMKAVGEHPDWSILLRLLASQLGDDMVLESVDIQQDAEKLPPSPAAKAASDAAAAASGKPAEKKDATPAMSPGGAAYTVRITGVGLTQQRVMGYASEIERLGKDDVEHGGNPIFSSVDIKRTSSVDFAGRTCVNFVMECRLSPRRKP